MPSILFLTKVQQVIIYLERGMEREAKQSTAEAEEALKMVPHTTSGFDDLVILNTALRAYWNGTPSVDIHELSRAYYAAVEATRS